MTAQLIGPGTVPESATSSIIDLGGLTRDTTQSTTAESGTYKSGAAPASGAVKKKVLDSP